MRSCRVVDLQGYFSCQPFFSSFQCCCRSVVTIIMRRRLCKPKSTESRRLNPKPTIHRHAESHSPELTSCTTPWHSAPKKLHVMADSGLSSHPVNSSLQFKACRMSLFCRIGVTFWRLKSCHNVPQYTFHSTIRTRRILTLFGFFSCPPAKWGNPNMSCCSSFFVACKSSKA